MKTLENVEKFIGSETFVKDTLLSKTGITLTLSTVAFGVLAGSQLLTPEWAFKIPYFIGGAYLLFGWIFGEAGTKEGQKKSLKEKVQSSENHKVGKQVVIGGLLYSKVDDNRYERV